MSALAAETSIMQAIHLHPDQRSRSIYEKRFVQFSFMLLFPGFFFYQTLLGLGMIRAFLGGYYSVVALALALPLAIFTLLPSSGTAISSPASTSCMSCSSPTCSWCWCSISWPEKIP